MLPPNDLFALLDAWLNRLADEGKSRETTAAYRRALTHFVQWHQRSYGLLPILQMLTPDLLDAWKAEQQTHDHAAARTINQRLVALTGFCRWAVAEGLLLHDPTITVSAIRTQPNPPAGLDSTALRRLLQAVHASGHVRDIAVIELLAGTGMRVSECLALRRADLALDGDVATVTIRAHTSTPARVLPLPGAVATALRAYLATLPPAASPDTSSWTSPQGTIAHRSTVLRLLRKYAAQAGLSVLTPQTLRDTFAIRYLAANPHDLRGLATVLGHATLSRVMMYSTSAPDDLAVRMERVMELLTTDTT